MDIWRFPKIGVPLNYPFKWDFPWSKPTTGGTPISGNPHIMTTPEPCKPCLVDAGDNGTNLAQNVCLGSSATFKTNIEIHQIQYCANIKFGRLTWMPKNTQQRSRFCCLPVRCHKRFVSHCMLTRSDHRNLDVLSIELIDKVAQHCQIQTLVGPCHAHLLNIIVSV